MAKASNPCRAIPFKPIRERAEQRKGGTRAMEKLLPGKPDMKTLAKLADDRFLAEMTQRVFSAGFAWSVIENKWPDFEKAFLGFKPAKLIFQPDDFWDALLSDTRIVRNGAKIASVARMPPSYMRSPRNTAASASFWPGGPLPTRSAYSICSPNAAA